MITVRDIIEKRKRIWRERGDIEYDRQLVRASVIKILSTPSLIEEIQEKPYLLIEAAFVIVDKKRKTVPFFFNTVQRDFIEKLEVIGTKKPFYILKGRQQGFTSLITAIQLSFAIVRKNFSGFSMADRADNTQAIFNDKARVVYDRLPEELKPSEKFNSKNEMFFDKLNSSWRVATATGQVGRSRTLNFVHFSEVAFYTCPLADLQAGIGEAIVAGAIQVYETTANGFNQAKELWDSGSCTNLFYEWWLTDEYRSNEYEYIDRADAWLRERIEVLKEKGCSREQIAWYSKKYAGYLDKNMIKQEFPISPDEAFISSGDCVFDKEIIANRLALSRGIEPLRCGYFTYKKEALPIFNSAGETIDVEWKISDISFCDDRDGYITIHDEPRVKCDSDGNITHVAPYSIGGDTAGSGEDYFTAKVICNLDGRTAATLRKQYIDEDLYAEQIYCLGKYYNDALVGLEINYSRQPTRILQKYGYTNLYMRERLDGMTDRPIMEYGFNTTSKTKPIIIGELVSLMREMPHIEPDTQTLKEMLTFVRKANGKQEAVDGEHDDLVMALAIGHFISKNQSSVWLPVSTSDEDFIGSHFSNFEGHTEENVSYISWEDF